MPREKSLQSHIRDFVREQPGCSIFVYHGSRFSVKGHPDLHGVMNGLAVYWETKAPYGVVTEAQAVLHRQLRKSGAVVFVCNRRIEFERQWKWLVEYRNRCDIPKG